MPRKIKEEELNHKISRLALRLADGKLTSTEFLEFFFQHVQQEHKKGNISQALTVFLRYLWRHYPDVFKKFPLDLIEAAKRRELLNSGKATSVVATKTDP